MAQKLSSEVKYKRQRPIHDSGIFQILRVQVPSAFLNSLDKISTSLDASTKIKRRDSRRQLEYDRKNKKL